MFKRVSFLLIVIVLILTLAACASASTESTPTEAPAAVEAETTDETVPEGEPDLAAAAEQLGVTEDALKAALGDPSQG